jgi:inhibitor of cysteine peptidase
MIKNWFTAICLALILSVVLIGCAPAAQSPVAVSVTCDDFSKQKDIVRDVSIASGGTFTITLCSNGTTGFQWGEKTQISDSQVLQQTGYKVVAAGNTGGKVGVPGTEVWDFKALKAGTSTVYVEYSRPWQGGEKGVQTFKLNVTVK